MRRHVFTAAERARGGRAAQAAHTAGRTAGRHILTVEECQRGWTNAVAAAYWHSHARLAWIYRHIRGIYRARRRASGA